MNTQADFATTYQNMSDGQLLETANEGGLVDDAKLALASELHRRNLKKSDLNHHKESPRERLNDAAQEKQLPLLQLGTGLFFFGKAYLNDADREANIQIRTKWIALRYVPLIPLASYRVKCKEQRWKFFRWTSYERILQRVPLNWNQVLLTWLKEILFVALIAAGSVLYFWLKDHH
ncbi:MAG: hypothetical protein ABSG84_11180 [Acidobacteriaceae bacterium]|jgi:hypothetical protein